MTRSFSELTRPQTNKSGTREKTSMTDKEARTEGVGGEVLCYVY